MAHQMPISTRELIMKVKTIHDIERAAWYARMALAPVSDKPTAEQVKKTNKAKSLTLRQIALIIQ